MNPTIRRGVCEAGLLRRSTGGDALRSTRSQHRAREKMAKLELRQFRKKTGIDPLLEREAALAHPDFPALKRKIYEIAESVRMPW